MNHTGTPRSGTSTPWRVAGSVTAAAALAAMSMAAAGPATAGGASPPPPTTAGDASTGSGVDTLWGDDRTKEGKKATQPTGSWVASDDRGSLTSITTGIGARAAWSQGVTGKDVTVAVIDTGIAPVPGLLGREKVMDGPDLSYDSQYSGTRYVDGYGHGTHMAGIIAGRDPGFDPKRPDGQSFAGVAPEAQLLNMKVGTGDGGADVSQVIAAIDWIVENRREKGMRIRVINLSYGTQTTQSWQVDPLARAVENAWDHGIVVVAAAGNDGNGNPLVMPAADPRVIAVGAVDHLGTATTSDDVVADFTNGGTTGRNPDVLAPGRSVVSLRVPQGYIDAGHPEGLVVGDDAGRYFRGSGTSQAAAVVSGEVALLLDKRPSLTPDQVKALLMRTSRPLATAPQGAGVTDVSAALQALDSKVAPTGDQSRLPRSSGLGSLEASRGGDHVFDPDTGTMLEGEVDALGTAWDPSQWVGAQSQDRAWNKGTYNGRAWTGDKWKDDRLGAVLWDGTSWSGRPWNRHAWSDSDWDGRSWRNNDWRGRSWREESWRGRSWRGLL